MDIRKIRYFISVAETLNFTRAARRHYISQTAMSQQIALLEEELGVILFERSTNKVKLTNAGSFFLKEAVVIVEKLEYAVLQTRKIAQGSCSSFTCGYSDPIELDILRTIADSYLQEYPNADIRFDEQNFSILLEKVNNGTCDVAFFPESEIWNLQDIRKLTLYLDKIILAVSRNHPKARLGKIPAIEVANEKIIMLSQEAGPNNYKTMLQYCRKDGYEPNIVELVPTFDMLMLLVELNRGVCFVPNTWRNKANDKLAFLEIEGTTHMITIEMAWRKDNKNEGLKAFIEVAKRFAYNETV
ncbi:LysR family transcriptional regulator [Dehalobacter sp. DCM]|uniref:LysR family transcriptional regulator n=1 Tax=Dehalobacter sp. DCM TaxID=2907827 RepID=UPI0030814FE7|nr:LysR family transcriptional regulator [Dehalobacter sp. DCM]